MRGAHVGYGRLRLGLGLPKSLDLDDRFRELCAATPPAEPTESHWAATLDLPAAPAVVWEWLNDPAKRSRWVGERTVEAVIFAAELHALDRRHRGYRLHEQITRRDGRITPAALEQLCPDWRERETFLCGPAGLLAAMREHWGRDGDPKRLHSEHFQPDAQLDSGEHGAGGMIRFCASNIEASSDGTQPILVAGESAGATLAHGCRMGICHSCVGRLRSGRVRDLRTGRVHGQAGEIVRICVNAPEGPVEIDL